MRFLGGMIAGSMIARHSARRQFEAMQASQAQQEQINQAQTHAAKAAQAQIQGQQGSNPGKKDPIQELERLGNLKQQGLLTEEEFKKLKIQLLSGS
jgi:hypothetical protein